MGDGGDWWRLNGICLEFCPGTYYVRTSWPFPLHLAPEARHSDARLIGSDLPVPAQGLRANDTVFPRCL